MMMMNLLHLSVLVGHGARCLLRTLKMTMSSQQPRRLAWTPAMRWTIMVAHLMPLFSAGVRVPEQLTTMTAR
jgi:hypothetical protein